MGIRRRSCASAFGRVLRHGGVLTDGAVLADGVALAHGAVPAFPGVLTHGDVLGHRALLAFGCTSAYTGVLAVGLECWDATPGQMLALAAPWDGSFNDPGTARISSVLTDAGAPHPRSPNTHTPLQQATCDACIVRQRREQRQGGGRRWQEEKGVNARYHIDEATFSARAHDDTDEGKSNGSRRACSAGALPRHTTRTPCDPHCKLTRLTMPDFPCCI